MATILWVALGSTYHVSRSEGEPRLWTVSGTRLRSWLPESPRSTPVSINSQEMHLLCALVLDAQTITASSSGDYDED